MKKSSIFTSFALVAGMSIGSQAAAYERVIPQSLIDRYGNTLTAPERRQKDQDCRGLRDLLSNGNVLKRSFANGQRRATIQVSPDDGGTIGFRIDLGTARGLKSQDCSSWMP